MGPLWTLGGVVAGVGLGLSACASARHGPTTVHSSVPDPGPPTSRGSPSASSSGVSNPQTASASQSPPGPGFGAAPQGAAATTSLLDDATDPDVRRRAVRRVLAPTGVGQSQDAPSASAGELQTTPDAIRTALDPARSTPQTQVLVLEEIARIPSAPAWLAKPVAGLLDSSEQGPATESTTRVAASAIRALGSVRTRESARALVRLAGGAGPRAAEARAALARLTGRGDLVGCPDCWEPWFAGVQWISEAEWRQALVEGLAGRVDLLAEQSRAALQRITDSSRQAYLSASSSEERSALLSSYIRDPLPEIRDLGMSLAVQELANARPLDGKVADAAASVLTNPSRDVREQAGALLRLIATEAHAAAIASALSSERDPGVAATLMQCAARAPSVEAVAPTVRWLGTGGNATGAAIDCLWAIQQAGKLDAEALRGVRDRLGGVETNDLTAGQQERARVLRGDH